MFPPWRKGPPSTPDRLSQCLLVGASEIHLFGEGECVVDLDA